MMEDKIIDASRCLNSSHIKEFTDILDKDCVIDAYISKSEYNAVFNIEQLISFFKDEQIISKIIDDDDEIMLLSQDKHVVLIFSGADYKWWSGTVKGKEFGRLDKLFSIPTTRVKETIPHSQQLIYCIAGLRDNNTVSNIERSVGNSKSILAFINDYHSINELRHNFNDSAVFYISYSDDCDVIDMLKWKSFNELVKEGVLVL